MVHLIRMAYYTDRSRLTSKIYHLHYEGSEYISPIATGESFSFIMVNLCDSTIMIELYSNVNTQISFNKFVF